eukprot:7817437-Ditylum_brightwellii.AAC.1
MLQTLVKRAVSRKKRQTHNGSHQNHPINMRNILLTSSKLSYTDCNAKTCFNIIHQGFASIIKKIGVTPNVSTLCVRTLCNMEYHMCSAKGVSEEKHCNSEEDPTYGSGQVMCDTGTKWNYTDIIMTRAYNKKATDCELVDPKQEIYIKQNS